MPTFAYVGAYTGPGKAEGIAVFHFNARTGELAPAHVVRGIENPSFLTFSADQRFLFAVSEVSTFEGQRSGAVVAYTVDHASGQLTRLNHQPAGGTVTCHVSVSASGRYVLVASYGSGQVATFPLAGDGRLLAASAVVQHEGRGPHPRRQEGPHAHFITPDPAGRFILSCDLGIDKILVYRLDEASGALLPNEVPYGQVASGEGPRHLAFHPSARWVYVLNEIGSSLSGFAYDPQRGTLTHLQTVSTLPVGFHGRNSCAQVVVHPTGHWVFASNRGHDSLATFAIDPASGRVTAMGHTPSGGQTPRNFALDPSGTWLLAANQDSGSIHTFRVEATSGQLAPTGHLALTPAPVCIVFADLGG